MQIKEIVVVEGRDDTVAIKRAVRADTIETGGSALNEDVYKKIELAMVTRGVIIFTDPDHAGERIRKQIAARVPGCKHAFIEAEQGMKKAKIGVEYASPETIRSALSQVWTEHFDSLEWYSMTDLLEAQLINHPQAHERRLRVGKHLRIGYANGKQLLKRLNMFQIPREQFAEAVSFLEGNNE